MSNFDKFMDDILIKENRKKKLKEEVEETAQRKYNKKYRELPNNRIVVKR